MNTPDFEKIICHLMDDKFSVPISKITQFRHLLDDKYSVGCGAGTTSAALD
jgi:hypothetical protein